MQDVDCLHFLAINIKKVSQTLTDEQYNYCPLILSITSDRKTNKLPEKCIRLWNCHYTSLFDETLTNKVLVNFHTRNILYWVVDWDVQIFKKSITKHYELNFYVEKYHVLHKKCRASIFICRGVLMMDLVLWHIKDQINSSSYQIKLQRVVL